MQVCDAEGQPLADASVDYTLTRTLSLWYLSELGLLEASHPHAARYRDFVTHILMRLLTKII